MTWWASGPFQNFYKSNLHFIIWIKIWIQNSNSASQKVSSGMLFYSSKYRVRPIKYMTSGPQKVSFRPWNTIFIGIQFQKQRSSTAQYAKFGRLPFLNRIMEPPEQKKAKIMWWAAIAALVGRSWSFYELALIRLGSKKPKTAISSSF